MSCWLLVQGWASKVRSLDLEASEKLEMQTDVSSPIWSEGLWSPRKSIERERCPQTLSPACVLRQETRWSATSEESQTGVRARMG